MGHYRLDHVSLVGDRALFAKLGFRVTPTAGSERHGRIFLDRTYLEVTPPEEGQPDIGSRGWFLRPSDPLEAAEKIRAIGLAAEGPAPYHGQDGTWVDVTVANPVSPALPIFTKRSDEPEDAWPPPMAEPHPNGAHRLAAIHLRLKDPAPLLCLLDTLGLPSREAGISLPGDERLMVERTEGRDGVVAVIAERKDGSLLTLNTVPLLN